MADESAVTVKFGGDVTGLDASVAVAKAKLQAFNAEIRTLAKEVSAAGGAANDNLVASLKAATAGAAGAQKELAGLGRATKDWDGISAEARKVRASLDKISEFAWNNTNLSSNQIERVVNPLKYLVTTIGTIPTALVAASIAAVAAIAAIGAAAIHAGEQAQELKSRFELSGAGVAKLGAVASKAGMETKDLGQALLDLSKKARQGDEDIIAAARALGLTADAIKSGDLPGLLRTLQQAYDRNGDSANKYAAFQKLLGNAFEQLYPAMQQGVSFLDQMYAAADRSGASTDRLREALDGTVAASQQSGAAWVEFKQSVEGAVLALYSKFKPAIDGAIQGFTDLLKSLAAAVQGFSAASSEGTATSVALDLIAAAAKALVVVLAAVTAAFESLYNAAKFVLSEIINLGTGVVNIFNEIWKSIKGGTGDIRGAWSAMTAAMAKDFKSAIASQKSTLDQFKGEFKTTMGGGALGAKGGPAGAQGLFKTGNPEAAKGGSSSSGADNVAQKRIEGEIAAERAGLEQKKALYEHEARIKQITEGEKLTLIRLALDEEYQAERALLEKEMALEGQKPAQKQAILNKLQALEASHVKAITQLNYQASEQIFQKWEQVFNQIGSSISTSIMGMLKGTMKLRDMMRTVATQITQMFISEGVKMVAARLAQVATDVETTVFGETAKTGATAAGAAARTSIEGTAAISGLAMKAGTIIKSILSSAAETFAGVFGFMSPVMGPYAAAPAAASAAAVTAMVGSVASNATGNWRVDRDQLSMIHAGEMIVPDRGGIANEFRQFLGGGGPGQGGGGGNTHVHLTVHANDSHSFLNMIKRDGPEITKHISRLLNDNPSLRPTY